MAGLQYYFFPTDFYYPRAISTDAVDNLHKGIQVIPPSPGDAVNCDGQTKGDTKVKMINSNNYKLLKIISMPTAIVPVPKKNK